MKENKNFVAMLLAGGQGSRLGPLTRSIAKPAVSFGGKYRIIDFSLSNCAHSSIDALGVLTQYKPMLLNSYIGTGEAWNLNAIPGGVKILPPYVGDVGGTWYNGTADAIYRNMDFLSFNNPAYVLILSGDHIYQMDYDEMLKYHIDRRADVTISVISIPLNEANRFGIMSTDRDNRITEFEEKPTHPKSDLASMGVYIFNWQTLRNSLIDDQANGHSDHDFGKNIIPTLLKKEKRLFAYEFDGYWKDVGTIAGYYEASMDLLSETPAFDIFHSNKRIYSNEQVMPSHFIGPTATVSNTIVSNGCTVLGQVKNSILSNGVSISQDVIIKDSIIMPHAIIESSSVICRAIIGENAAVGNNSLVGSEHDEIMVVPGLKVKNENIKSIIA